MSIDIRSNPYASAGLAPSSAQGAQSSDGVDDVNTKEPANPVNLMATLPMAASGAFVTSAGDLPSPGGERAPFSANGPIKEFFGDGRKYSVAAAIQILSESYAQQVQASSSLGAQLSRLQQDAAARKADDAVKQTQEERSSAWVKLGTQMAAVAVGGAMGVGGAAWGAKNPGTSGAAMARAASSMSGQVSQLISQTGDTLDKTVGHQYKADEAMLKGKMDELAQMQLKSLDDQMNSSKDEAKKRAQSLIDMEMQIRQAQGQTANTIAQNSGQ